MISNTFDIIMAVFDVTQQVVANSSGIISGNTRVNDIGLSMLQSSMMQMDVGPLFGLFLQSFFIGITIESLERRIQEAEAAEVNEMVRTAKVTPEQLAALLRQSANTTPNPAALSAVGATCKLHRGQGRLRDSHRGRAGGTR